MKLREVFEIITKQNGILINQTVLAESLGITRQTVSNRIKNESEVTVSEIQKIENFFNIKLDIPSYVQPKNTFYADYYPDVFVSCGFGSLSFSEEKYPILIPKEIISEYSPECTYSLINAKGDSMVPSIYPHDKLIIKHSEFEQIEDNKIYVFCYKNELFVKRLSKNIDEVIVKSDNPEYSTKIISSKDLQNLVIIGKVTGIIRSGF